MIRLALVLSVLALQGCAAVIVAGGVGVAASAHDRRTIGTQIDDKTLTARISNNLSENKNLDEFAHVSVNVFNGIAILVGQTPNDDLRNQAEQAAKNVQHIRKLHNQIRIGSPTSTGTRANDVWLASKVKTNLIADKRIDGLHIDIVVEDSEVFLMGLVNENEANIAVDIARNIGGVARVVKAFEYLN
ncbi:BON domain-containing protein [Neptunicella sp. SCSIO 80796]|uniref:BON domain-containing protein n=1 Tax=Neptunicella plasticusilytica TaxID=3117012 RepID=UPI003A4DDAE5